MVDLMNLKDQVDLDLFDQDFMPLSKASAEKWKRIDRAFRLGQELAPVSLLELGRDYFVTDGNHRVSVLTSIGSSGSTP